MPASLSHRARPLVAVLLVGWLASGGSALVLAPDKAPRQFPHRVWQTADGLPQNSVLSLAQTPDGYLWGSTWEGLVRFDGVRFTVFNKTNTPAAEVRHRARVVKDYGPVPAVLGDETRLGQVFLNLIINAAQAIPEGQASQHEIRITTREDERGQVVVAVSDTGGGIPPEVLSRIFEPFFTTKPVGVGTGLGLSICHSYVQAMGGDIRVRSEVGRGTTFEVVLRSAQEGSPVVPFVGATASAGMGPRGRLLVIDDEPLLLAALSRTLAAEHEVVALGGARPALERLRAGERYSLILCDVMMPEMTGLELYQTLVREVPGQAERMVFLSGGAFSGEARVFLETTRRPCVDKPFEPEALRARILALLVAHEPPASAPAA